MEVVLTVTDDRGRPWEETYNWPRISTLADARAKAEAVIQGFNDTLRPHEQPRTLVDVKETATGAHEPHEWEKTNLITQSRGMSHFDTMKCPWCGITGKRFGLKEGVIRDRPYRAKVYDHCDTARAHLAKQSK